MPFLRVTLASLKIGITYLVCFSICYSSENLLVVQSHDTTPYQQVYTGFKKGLATHNITTYYQTLTLTLDNADEHFKQQLQSAHPSLILTLGTPATEFTLQRESKIPVVASLLLNTKWLSNHANATGVSLNFPAEQQWLWLRRLLPDAKHIAVIYNPLTNIDQWMAFQQQAQASNIELTPVPITRIEDFATLLQGLNTQLDAVLTLQGPTYNEAAIRELLLYSFRNRVPLIGLSAQWVKAGALYALDWDYQDLGIQAAEQAIEIIKNKTMPQSLTLQIPRKAKLVLNSQTVEYMKLDIPEAWLSEVTEVLQ
ncbi:ABC transporter substrate-binding protein [Methylocucumis oryzae]|uniref:ABC transporter substrate-binding protein n=1 Tax=Methylocucumis oryzae TaxID=1632867 RepID=A0A0F3IGN7_9GAMM|nr:ABC transporter substrate binding protein [Methylocucumis oryzae]KJV05867.1 hypothetical protein VZ94_15055 [Methylocucumis oryzae]